MSFERARQAGLLGDTASRDYSCKLRLFNAFAAPELREAAAALMLKPGARVLDAGCGTGETLRWLREAVGASGLAVGIDLAAAHVAASRDDTCAGAALIQGDLTRPCFARGSFDLLWSVNTINHVRDPVAAIGGLAALVHSGGRVAVGQSSLQPDMIFAWDADLERAVHDSVRRYYLARYGLASADIRGVRAIVGWMRAAGLRDVRPRTLVIERTSPLRAADEAYLIEVIFRGTWGERLDPYLTAGQQEELRRLCDPAHPGFALRRPDFHLMQTFTLVLAEVP